MDYQIFQTRCGLKPFVYHALVLVVLLTCMPLLALPAGTRIDNQAQATFINADINTPEQITSNLVSAVVENRYALSLLADSQQAAATGQVVFFPHRLRSDSSVDDSVTLQLINLAGDSFDFSELILWLDSNRNGQLDSADTVLSETQAITIAPGADVELLVEARLPAGQAIGEFALLQLTANGSGNTAAVIDRVTVSSAEPQLLVDPPEKNSLQSREAFQLNTVFLSALNKNLNGIPVRVDGVEKTLVIMETRLPAGVFLERVVDSPSGYSTLYKMAGSPQRDYTESVPGDLRQVSAVAIAKPEVAANEAPQFSLALQAEGEGRTISILSTVYYEGGETVGAPYTVTLQAAVDSSSLLSINNKIAGEQPIIVRTNGPMALRFNCFICDGNPDLVDAVLTEVSSAATGDKESVDLIETGPRAGEFYTDALAVVAVEDAAVVADNGSISVDSNDVLTLTVKDTDGNTLEQQTVLVDPAGYVFNSVTGTPIINAEVTLYRIAADSSETLAEVFYDEAGTRPHPNPTFTNDEGYYEFPFVAPGDYRLEVTNPTPGFSFASSRSGEDMAEVADFYTHLTGFDASGNSVTGRQISRAEGASYGGVFSVVADAVFIDIPVDPDYLNETSTDARGLGLSLTADRKQATFGEAVRYTARVSNLSGQAIEQAMLEVKVPRGFQLLPDSVFWNGQPLTQAVSEEGGRLLLPGEAMASDETAELLFRLVLTPAALGGDGVVTARATAQGLAPEGLPVPQFYSAFGRVKVILDQGVFRDDGVIIGKVFRDCNGNGLQDSEASESGLAGIRLYLQNGRYVETDAAGRYSFPRLRSGSYVIKVDPASIDGRWQLTHHSVSSSGSDQLRWVDLLDGELHRADFPVAGCSQQQSPDAYAHSLTIDNGELATDDSDKSPSAAGSLASLIRFPQDGARIAGGQTAITLTGKLGLAFELHVNETPVPESRLGEQRIDKVGGEQQLLYYGIDLQEGGNTLTAVARDNWGNVRAQQQITVYRPGALRTLRWQAAENLFAGSGEHTLQLELLDAAGIPIAGDVVVTLAIVEGNELAMTFTDTDIDAVLPGVQQLAVDGRLAVPIMAPSLAGRVRVVASAGNVSADKALDFVPQMRNWIVSGLLEGTVSRQINQRGELDESREHRGFNDRIESNDKAWNDGKNRAAVRGALFAKGTVKDDYLVTVIADTDKREQDDWDGPLDLEKDFPTYGDDSLQGSEGAAEKGLYLRVEKDSSFVQIGDFRPGSDNRRTRVGGYNRQLYGLQQYYQGEHWQLETFASKVSTTQVIDNLRLRGTTGPFSLSQRDIVTNSEKIEVITRSRAPDGDIIAFETLTPFIDYELDPVLGRIILRAPMAGSDQSGRPRYLRVSYLVDEDNGVQRDLVGTDISYQFTDLTVGARLLHERDSDSHYNLSSINSLYQLGDNTTLVAEYADSRREGLDTDSQGQAVNTRLEHLGEQRTIQLTMSGASSDFDNVSAAVTPNSRSADFSWQEHVSDNRDVWAAARWFENSTTNINTYAAELGATQTLDTALKVGMSLEETRTDTSTGVRLEESSLGLHARYQPGWLDEFSLQSNAYQALGSQRQRQKVAADYRLPNQGSVGLSWERFSGYDVNGDLETGSNSRQRWAMGYRQQVHSTTELFSEYRFEEASNGLENSVATGMRYGYDINQGLRLSAQAERTLDLADNPNDPARYSASLGLSGFAEDNHKWLVRLEVLAADEQRWLQEFRWASRVNTDWSILAKERLQWRDGFTGVNAESTVGLAYRPLDHNRWDWLASYSLEREKTNEATLTRQSTRNTVNIRPADKWTVSGGLVVQHTEQKDAGDYSSLAWMSRLRLRYDLSEDWSVGVMGSYFKEQRLDGGSRGWGVEVQRSLGKQFVVSVGLQHFDYEDKHVDPESAYRDGLMIRFGGKFDERSLAGLWGLLD